MLEGEAFSAIFEKKAESWAVARPDAEGDIEHLHEDLAHIAPHPGVEDGDQKIAIRLAGDTPPRDGGFRLPGLGGLGVIEAGGFPAGGWQAFYEGNELEVAGSHRAQEVIDLDRMFHIGGADDGECIELDAVFFQQLQALHDAVEGWLLALVHAIGVVEASRAVDTEPDEKSILSKKLAPGVVEQGSIRLKRVVDDSATRVFFLQLHDFAEIVQPQQRGLAALPGKGHLKGILGFDVLLDVCLQHLGFHSKVLTLGIQGFLFEVVAVGAIEIADRANGLGHHMEVFGNGRLRVQNEPVVYGWISLPQKGFLPLPDSPTFQPLSPIFLTFDKEKTVESTQRSKNPAAPVFPTPNNQIQ